MADPSAGVVITNLDLICPPLAYLGKSRRRLTGGGDDHEGL